MSDPSERQAARLDRSVAAFVLMVFIALTLRAALPVNRERGGMAFQRIVQAGRSLYFPRDANVYDNVITQVTAHNFVRDGFWHTHLLPNRAGAPDVSLYDLSQTQCETVTPAREPLVYRDLDGAARPMLSLGRECIYTHYPPLADWIFGGVAALGLQRVLHFKVLAAAANCAFLWLLYLWLRREVARAAAAVTVLLAGTLQAFWDWGDALYYHSFQYLLLIAGTWCFTNHLAALADARRAARWSRATWCCFFLEALASYQLTFAFMIVLAGLSWAHTSSRAPQQRFAAARVLLLQALAPCAAYALHSSLIISLFGIERTRQNLAKTFGNRLGHFYPHGFAHLFEWADAALLPWWLLALGLTTVLVARRAAGLPLRRALKLLTTFALAGISFMVALPGTTSWHGWMMYRQLMPFELLVVAYLADSLVGAVHALAQPQAWRRSLLLLVSASAAALCLAALAQRNFRHLAGEVAWNLRTRRHDPQNLVNGALDVVYWSEGQRRPLGMIEVAVSGMRVSEPRGWQTDFRLPGPERSSYEVWWLNDVAVRSARVLVDRAQTDDVERRCRMELFRQGRFESLAPLAALRVVPFEPESGEATPRVPYSWLTWQAADSLRLRALRFSCSGHALVTLRQLEAFAN